MPANLELKVKVVSAGLAGGRRLVTQSVLDRYNKTWPGKIRSAIPEVRELVRNQLIKSEVYFSLINGTLKGEFGLGDEAAGKVNSLVEIIVQSVRIDFEHMKLVFPRVTGGIGVVLDTSVYNNLLDSGFGEYVSPKSGSNIAWLDWLLTKGDRIIIKEFHVLFGDNLPNSRSGMALMYKDGSYKVDARFAGTVEPIADNWLTRTLSEDDVFTFSVSSILFRKLI